MESVNVLFTTPTTGTIFSAMVNMIRSILCFIYGTMDHNPFIQYAYQCQMELPGTMYVPHPWINRASVKVAMGVKGFSTAPGKGYALVRNMEMVP